MQIPRFPRARLAVPLLAALGAGGALAARAAMGSDHQDTPEVPATARWTFFAHSLPALRPGRDYQLWLITPAGPVSAGVFRPTPEGQAEVQATYPLPRDQLKAIAVTEEPAGGLPAPSGQPLIVGAASE
jgi:anti-sigma-K factor RskA